MNVCTICSDPRLAEINAAWLSGTSLRRTARDFQLSLASLHRHSLKHVKRPLETQDLSDPVSPERVPDEDRDAALIARTALRHLRRAMKSGEDRDRATAITAGVKALELTARLRGRLHAGATNVTTVIGVSVEQAKDAVDFRARVDGLDARSVCERAQAILAAGCAQGDAQALRAVRELAALAVEHSGALVQAQGDTGELGREIIARPPSAASDPRYDR